MIVSTDNMRAIADDMDEAGIALDGFARRSRGERNRAPAGDQDARGRGAAMKTSRERSDTL